MAVLIVLVAAIGAVHVLMIVIYMRDSRASTLLTTQNVEDKSLRDLLSDSE